MISIGLLVALVGLIEARPNSIPITPTFDMMIIGGENAIKGEFPWQLSQQRLGGTWSHSCGASLLSGTRALSAAHCVEGANANILRVIAGLHQRSDMSGTATSDCARTVLHPDYNTGSPSFSNDISIIYLFNTIATGNGIAYATLPANNNNDFAGDTCVISGWGRTSNAQTLPDTLQKVSIKVLTLAACRTAMGTIGTIWEGHICLNDDAGVVGSCNGDSGGPLNCPGAGNSRVVAGITSFGVSTILGNCLTSYPSVYTRTSAYLTWIDNN